ncbi:hypothetical protein DV736_g4381, partial [Chaetothyriales sp. CBS 134916]
MDAYDHESEHRKKRRRRREIAAQPIRARLTFNDSVKGDDAVLSPALWQLLYSDQSSASPADGQPPPELHSSAPSSASSFPICSSTTFVALSPSTPLHTSLEDSAWTISPARASSIADEAAVAASLADNPHWVCLSSKACAVAAFLNVFAAVDHNRHGGHVPKSIDIKIVPAAPLALESVLVTVERGLLDRVDEIQQRFGGGFPLGKTKRAAAPEQSPQSQEDRLRAVIREGLARVPLLHAGDVFQLPLPAHPITHARQPPAIAIDCEPVSQGRVTAKTRIVLVQTGSSQEKAVQKLTPTQPIIEESLEDTAEDTSNDQFFSAAEDKDLTTSSEAEAELDDDDDGEDSATEDSEQDNSDDDSDSMEDIISLSAPGLPAQQAGTLSAMTMTTPRPGDRRTTGINTPGSIYSTFSASTARIGSRPGKVFRTEALLRKLPVDILHPKPGPEDDDDSFVFVDTTSLAKIGCFSGDWVRIEVSKNITLNGFPSTGFSALQGLPVEEESEWRTVKIFGLSGLGAQKARYAVDKTGDRRSSFSGRESFTSLTPKLFLSPVLLANLSNAPFVKVGALPNAPRHDLKQRPSTSKAPPTAREVSLLKISTPITTRKDLQPALFSGLKRFFEEKKRIIKRGDLLAIAIDQDLGTIISASGGGENDATATELAAALPSSMQRAGSHAGVAWFKVQSLEAEEPSDFEEFRKEQRWGGVVVVDHQTVRLQTQAGSSLHAVSDLIEAWTKYWLGMLQVPRQSTYRSELVITPSALPQLDKLPLEKRLSNLIAAATSSRAVALALPALVILLHSTQRQIGKTYTAQSACSSVGVHTFPISGYDLLSENASSTGGGDVKTEATLKARAELALSCGAQQTAILIQNIDLLTAARMEPTLQDLIHDSRVLIATTSKIDDVPAGIRSLFTHEFEISAPNETSREIILRNASISTGLPLSPGISLKNIALQTAALVAGDLLDVVNRAHLARSRRLCDLAISQSRSVSDVLIASGQSITHLLPSDFTSAISAARSTFSDAIGAPKIPTVTWADVGGLASQKDAIMETISLPLTRPELFANGIRKRSGILFYGPPGTGKTLLAKAIATEFSLNFFSVKGPELLNMYIGESEANVRRVFQRARDARPCVVFFDELDSVAPKRGNQGDSGGVMDRIVSQLLAELDGMSSSPADDGQSASGPSGGSGVFVIGATNRPDLLDPALLRPGRFDKMLYLGVADSHDQQVTILQALTRKFTLDDSVDLNRVASRLPFTYTGADLYALCSDAMLKAITRKTEAVDAKVAQISLQRGEDISTGYFFDHLATDADTQVVVNEDDFTNAQAELVGSVSRKELDHFERIRSLFEEQDISAGEKKLTEQTQFTTRLAPNENLPLQRTNPERLPNPLPQSTKQPAPSQSRQSSLGNLKTKDTNTKVNAPTQPASQRFQRIGNPDSGQDSDLSILDPDAEADYSAVGESDFGVSSRHLNGILANGNAKGKGKARADGFMHDSLGDEDDGLYD